MLQPMAIILDLNPNQLHVNSLINRTPLFMAILGGLVAIAFGLSLLVEKPESFEVEYHAETFVVPLEDPSYTESQAARIQSLIISQLPPSRFESFSAMISFHNFMEVPGCGSSTGGFGDETPLGLFTFVSVEIPNKPKHRVFVYRSDNHEAPYTYVDDFIFENAYPPQLFFEIYDGKLNYRHDGSNRIVRSLPLDELPSRDAKGSSSLSS